MKLIILIGLPGSGKSTWAKEQKVGVLSSDEIRGLLSGDENNQQINAKVFGTMRHLLRQRLDLHMPVTVIDSTNIERKWRKPWIKIAKQKGAQVEAVFFDTPVELCKQRNQRRDRVVPNEAIDEMAAKLKPPSKDEGFDQIRTIPASANTKTHKAES